MKVHVCASCTQDGKFVDELRVALPDLDVQPIDCMSGCARAQTVAFRAPGKTAYLFGEIDADDFEDLRRFARLYAASPDGTITDARVLGGLRMKAIARIPG